MFTFLGSRRCSIFFKFDGPKAIIIQRVLRFYLISKSHGLSYYLSILLLCSHIYSKENPLNARIFIALFSIMCEAKMKILRQNKCLFLNCRIKKKKLEQASADLIHLFFTFLANIIRANYIAHYSYTFFFCFI